MTDAEVARSPRLAVRRGWRLTLAIVGSALIAIELAALLRGGSQALALPDYLALIAATVLFSRAVLMDRAARHGALLAEALAADDRIVVPIIETRSLVDALGEDPPVEFVPQVGALALDRDGVQVWVLREARSHLLGELPWAAITEVGVADAVLGIRRSRAVRLVRATDVPEDRAPLTIVVAEPTGRGYAPAGDARFAEALRSLRSGTL